MSLAYITVNHYVTKIWEAKQTRKKKNKKNNAATFSVLVQNVTKHTI